MIDPVPPLTVRIPASLRMTSIDERELSGGLIRKDDQPTFWRGPARYLARQVNANDFWTLELPRKVSEHIDCICSTNSYTNHSHSTSIWSVRVGPDYQATWKDIVFE